MRSYPAGSQPLPLVVLLITMVTMGGTANGLNATLGLITTIADFLVAAENQQPLIQMAIDVVNSQQVVPGLNFTVVFRDDHGE